MAATARRSAAFSCAPVWEAAPGSIRACTARAASSSRRAHASAMARALYRSMSPRRSAARVSGSRPDGVRARCSRSRAAPGEIRNASATSSATKSASSVPDHSASSSATAHSCAACMDATTRSALPIAASNSPAGSAADSAAPSLT